MIYDIYEGTNVYVIDVIIFLTVRTKTVYFWKYLYTQITADSAFIDAIINCVVGLYYVYAHAPSYLGVCAFLYS